jgi:hypothetical protein
MGYVRQDYSDNGNAWDYFSPTRPVPVLITGAKMDWPAFPTNGSGFASL